MNAPRPSVAAAGRAPSRRVAVVAWLRRTHGWVGLWGAALGLLFGVSGVWLNHRTVLPLPVGQARSSAQLALPEPPPADAQALADWVRAQLRLGAPTNVRVEPAKPLAWVERPLGGPVGSALSQPEHWTIAFGGPKDTVQAEYWAGNRSVAIRRTANGLAGTLANLHKGVGMPVAWILLVDTLAGSLVVLSLSGLALWMLTRRRRVVGVAVFGTALALAAGLALARL